MKSRVGVKNITHKISDVFTLGKKEMEEVTAEDWAKAVRLAEKEEDLYAKIDKIDTDEQVEPDVQVEPEEQPQVQPEIIASMPSLKCPQPQCPFETLSDIYLKQHLEAVDEGLDSFEACNEASKRWRKIQKFSFHCFVYISH